MKIYFVVVTTADKDERDRVLGMLDTFEDDIPNAQVSTSEDDIEPEDER